MINRRWQVGLAVLGLAAVVLAVVGAANQHDSRLLLSLLPALGATVLVGIARETLQRLTVRVIQKAKSARPDLTESMKAEVNGPEEPTPERLVELLRLLRNPPQTSAVPNPPAPELSPLARLNVWCNENSGLLVLIGILVSVGLGVWANLK